MNEFIEKLINRLEEYKYSHLLEHNSEECLHCQENEDDWNCFNRNCLVCVCDRTISIVNELAEEYNNDFCEWQPNKQFNWFLKSPHEGVGIAQEEKGFFKFCPCCGKKIKVVE